MGKCFMRCTYDVGPAWQAMVAKMCAEIIQVSTEFENDIEIEKIWRDGCLLNVNYAIPGAQVDTTYIYAIEGIISTYVGILKPICPKCGKHKGLAPSLCVSPGVCEECRFNLSPYDFAGSALIGLVGKAGSGKDTVATQLVEKHGFKRMALADPLRDIVQLAFVLDHDNVWDRELREQPIEFLNDWTVRKLLQFVGTELFRRQVWDDIWMHNLLQRLEPGQNYVISDIRFPNEMSGLLNGFGGVTKFVDVIREGCDGAVGIPNHESEAHTFKADIVIDNNGTLEELYDKVEKLVLDIDRNLEL